MHSVRAAAASTAVMPGLTVEDILKVTDWFREGIFQKFYYRFNFAGKFGMEVMVAASSKSH